MKKLLKQLLGESAIYGLSGMASKIIGVFLMPLYTRVLLPSDYGELNLINNTFLLLSLFLVFGLDNSTARWYYDSENEDERKKTVASWFWFQLFFSVLLGFILLLFSGVFSKWIVDSDNSLLFIIPSLGLIANVLPTVFSNLLRFQRMATKTVVFTLSISLINIGLNILFVLVLDYGVIGILMSAFLGNVIGSLYGFISIRRWVKFSYFSMRRLKEMLRFAYPLIPTFLAMWVLNNFSSYIIEEFSGKNEVGLFQVGLTISASVTLVVGAFQMAWGPFSFSILKNPEAKRTYSAVLTLYAAISCFLALAVGLFAKELLALFTTSLYYEAAFVTGILAFNNIIFGFVYIINLGPSIMKNNKPLAVAILIGATSSTILFFLLIPKYGMEGAAFATIFGNSLIPIFLFFRAQKLWYIPYKTPLVLIIFIAAILIFVVFQGLETLTMIVYIKAAALAAYGLLVLIMMWLFYRRGGLSLVK